jgi:hypothetical protein
MKVININEYALKKKCLPNDIIYYETGKATINQSGEEVYKVICGFTQKGDAVVEFDDKNILISWEEILELAFDKYLEFKVLI